MFTSVRFSSLPVHCVLHERQVTVLERKTPKSISMPPVARSASMNVAWRFAAPGSVALERRW